MQYLNLATQLRNTNFIMCAQNPKELSETYRNQIRSMNIKRDMHHNTNGCILRR